MCTAHTPKQLFFNFEWIWCDSKTHSIVLGRWVRFVCVCVWVWWTICLWPDYGFQSQPKNHITAFLSLDFLCQRNHTNDSQPSMRVHRACLCVCGKSDNPSLTRSSGFFLYIRKCKAVVVHRVCVCQTKSIYTRGWCRQSSVVKLNNTPSN